jgi:hypothetical protein
MKKFWPESQTFIPYEPLFTKDILFKFIYPPSIFQTLLIQRNRAEDLYL